MTIGGVAAGFSTMQRSASKSLGEPDFTNAIITFELALKQNPMFCVLVAIGILGCIRGLFTDAGCKRARWAMLLAFGATLGSLAFYSLSYPYYYPFMLAPAAVLCGAGLSALHKRVRPTATWVAAIWFGLTALLVYNIALRQDNSAQRETLDAVHRIFPEPAAYIDRCSMVSSYPKVGFFMSVWGMDEYYSRGAPVMRSIIEREQPHFLIANRRMLELDDLGPEEYGPAHFGLFKEDVETLKANFVRHWGAIYVAGKHLRVGSDRRLKEFEILISGPYTVESPVPVEIDGQELKSGAVVTLDKGLHRLRAGGTEVEVTLRWGDHLFRPDEQAPDGPLFTRF